MDHKQFALSLAAEAADRIEEMRSRGTGRTAMDAADRERYTAICHSRWAAATNSHHYALTWDKPTRWQRLTALLRRT